MDCEFCLFELLFSNYTFSVPHILYPFLVMFMVIGILWSIWFVWWFIFKSQCGA